MVYITYTMATRADMGSSTWVLILKYKFESTCTLLKYFLNYCNVLVLILKYFAKYLYVLEYLKYCKHCSLYTVSVDEFDEVVVSSFYSTFYNLTNVTMYHVATSSYLIGILMKAMLSFKLGVEENG